MTTSRFLSRASALWLAMAFIGCFAVWLALVSTVAAAVVAGVFYGVGCPVRLAGPIGVLIGAVIVVRSLRRAGR